MRKKCLLIILVIMFSVIPVRAQENTDVIDYDNIQKTLDKLSADNVEDINFRDIINDILSGKFELSASNITKTFLKTLFNEFTSSSGLMAQILIISVIIAIFTNFATAFGSKYIGEVGFFVTYLILFSIIIKSFRQANSLSIGTINSLLTFMQVLIPSFFGAVTLSAGANSSIVFYQLTLLIITLVDWILIKLIIPLISILVAMDIVDNITEEPLISKLSELLRGGINWTLKTILLSFFGLNLIQSLTTPIIDTFAGRSIKHVMTSVPVIGNTLDGVTDTILGSAMLIKNAVGVGGLIVLLLICLIPIFKLLAFVLLYKLTAAVIEPISDKRVVNCLNNVGEASKLLLGTIMTAALLFIISIAIVTLSTNFSYFAR